MFCRHLSTSLEGLAPNDSTSFAFGFAACHSARHKACSKHDFKTIYLVAHRQGSGCFSARHPLQVADCPRHDGFWPPRLRVCSFQCLVGAFSRRISDVASTAVYVAYDMVVVQLAKFTTVRPTANGPSSEGRLLVRRGCQPFGSSLSGSLSYVPSCQGKSVFHSDRFSATTR